MKLGWTKMEAVGSQSGAMQSFPSIRGNTNEIRLVQHGAHKARKWRHGILPFDLREHK